MTTRLDHSAQSAKTQVLVIGGGYAGVMAANRLTQRDDVAVTLVNPRDSFIHRIRLHQYVGGSDEAVVHYSEILSEHIRLIVDSVTQINASELSVTLAGGDTVGYDYLVYALGSGSATPDVPGAAEHAFPMASVEEAQRTRAALADVPDTAPVTVVGGGPSGIEISAELAEAGRHVTLVCGEVLNPYLHPKVRRKIAKRLVTLGVRLIDGVDAKVTAVARGAVELGDGRSLPSEVTIWTAGFSVPDLAARSGLSTDADGRLLTDETLASVDDPRIFAAGDSAAPSGLPLRMSCQAANPLGAHAADNVLRRIACEDPTPIEEGLFFQCIALGREHAIVQLASRQDSANRFYIGGRLGAKIKNTSFPGLVKELAHEGHEPGSYSWRIKNPKRQEQVDAARSEAMVA